jgi:hypothetical protein
MWSVQVRNSDIAVTMTGILGERRLQAKVEEFGARTEAIKTAFAAARAKAFISEAFAGCRAAGAGSGGSRRHPRR